MKDAEGTPRPTARDGRPYAISNRLARCARDATDRDAKWVEALIEIRTISVENTHLYHSVGGAKLYLPIRAGLLVSVGARVAIPIVTRCGGGDGAAGGAAMGCRRLGRHRARQIDLCQWRGG